MVRDKEQIRHIYIHVPFCVRKCGYCSFYSKEPQVDELEGFIETLLSEIEYYKSIYELKCETIYLGGGTPSLLDQRQLDSIINQIPRSSNCEITLEANPGDITKTLITSWKNTGVNRVSIGLQSMKNKELEFLGRRHSVEDNFKAIEKLKDGGIDNISFDLIYGLPGQNLPDVEYSIKEYLKLSPGHISTYCLSLSDDCLLADQRKNLPSDETLSDMYFLIRSMLLSSDWQQYELSSFCKEDRESKHNLAYWRQKKYLGCGPSAAGYVSGFRYQNPASYNQWHKEINASKYLNDQENIDEILREKEYIILGLRTIKGLKISDFFNEFRTDFPVKYREILVKYRKLKLVEEDDGYIRLMPNGYFISNEILSDFV